MLRAFGNLYDALVILSDGRRLYFPTSRRRLRVPKLNRHLRATVTVRAVSDAGMKGPAAKRKLR